MVSFEFQPPHAGFGARITGIDLKAPLIDAVVAAVREAIDTNSLVHFSNRHLCDDRQLALTQALGTPEANPVTLSNVSVRGTDFAI